MNELFKSRHRARNHPTYRLGTHRIVRAVVMTERGHKEGYHLVPALPLPGTDEEWREALTMFEEEIQSARLM